jgi:hypothetical protein
MIEAKKLGSVDEFKFVYKATSPQINIDTNKNPREQILQRQEERSPFAIAARLGGSTVDFAITGLEKEPNGASHFELDIKKLGSKEAAVKALFEIIATVSTQAKILGQQVLPVTLGVAGFETSKHQNLFNSQHRLPQKPGLHMLPNFSFTQGTSQYQHPNASSLINFIAEMTTALKSDFQINYQDEAGKSVISQNGRSGSTAKVDFTVINDTIAIANSEVNNLQDKENVLSMVCGSGMNIGISKNFDSNKKDFAELINTESGHIDISNNPNLVSELDMQTFTNGFIESLTPDKLFAGGAKERKLNTGVQAKIDYLRSLKIAAREDVIAELLGKLFVDYKESGIDIEKAKSSAILSSNDQMDSQAIMKAYRDGDQLAKLLVLDLVTRLARFINSYNQELIKDPNTKKLVITGSHLEDMLSDPVLKQTFDKVLNQEREAQHLQVINLEKGKMDGLKDLVIAKAASLRAQRV